MAFSDVPVWKIAERTGTAYKRTVITPTASAGTTWYRAFFVGTGGDLTVWDSDGTAKTYPNLPDATTIDGGGFGVSSASTASDILGLE